MRRIYYLILILVGFGFLSCNETLEVGGTATEKLAGEWWFALLDENGDVVDSYESIAHKLSTYNTADNSESVIWVDDEQAGWWIKAKVKADPATLTFGSQDSVLNLYEDLNVIVSNGQIWEGAAVSKDGNKTDSIRFTTTYTDGTVFIYAGHRHTGFEEDEYH